jgi:hypothetical protein
MSLELLQEADYVLNKCGRPVAPKGYRFVDLPRILPYRQKVTGFGEGGTFTSSQGKLQNNSNTLFLCKGLAASAGTPAFRLKWPNGRFFNQHPFAAVSSYPQGVGAAMFAFKRPQPIEKGGRIGIEQTGEGTVLLQFWGVLRYLMKDTGPGSPAESSCILGYPAWATGAAGNGFKIQTMADPIGVLENLDRYLCGPNQNIYAPEFRMNVDDYFTPEGSAEESFNFFSPPIVVAAGAQNYGTAVIIPGSDDVVLKRWRAVSTWDAETVGDPVVGMRLPSGYSITGGDLVPCSPLFWTPFFPRQVVAGSGKAGGAGGRIIVDVGNIDASGDNITTVIEFEGVKRRAA